MIKIIMHVEPVPFLIIKEQLLKFPMWNVSIQTSIVGTLSAPVFSIILGVLGSKAFNIFFFAFEKVLLHLYPS